MIYIIIGLLMFLFGGVCRGLFECILLHNSLYLNHHWSKYWSRDLFWSEKDRNKDGKRSYLETTFPNDGGHRIKILELFLYGLGGTFLTFGTYNNFIYILPFVIWFVISAGFELTYSNFRK